MYNFEIDTQIAIERSVLSTYIYFDNFYFKEKINQVDSEVFYMPFHKRVMSKFNEALKENIPLGLKAIELEEKIKGTQYEDDWLYILATNPLPLNALIWYVDKLKEKKIKRELEND